MADFAVRDAVRRAARARPSATVVEVAAAVGCHPATAGKHLRGLRRRVPATTAAPGCGTHAYERRRDGPRRPEAVPAGALWAQIRQAATASTVSAVERFAAHSDPLVRAAAAYGPAAGPLLGRLCRDPVVWVAAAAAANPRCPQRDRDRLLRLGDPRAAAFAAGPPGPARAAQACNIHWSARQAAAASPGCGPRLLGRLGSDCDTDVQTATAANPGCPQAVLRRLARSPMEAVRAAAAANPACGAGLAARLGRDPHPAVRVRAAASPSTPPRTLERLAVDCSQPVTMAAARNPRCPPQALRSLFETNSADIRAAVSDHPACPPEILARLADSNDEGLRHAAARHPSCPPQVVQRLRSDPDPVVAAEAQRTAARRLAAAAQPAS